MSSLKPKVLVVDDEPAMREVLEMRLQKWGYDVRLAADGIKGKTLAASFDPDIVLSDVVMPQMSGLELLKSLKGEKFDRTVILMTAQGTIEIAVDAMKSGAHDFLTKPLDYPKLQAMLDAASRELELRRDSRKLSEQLQSGGFADFVGTSRAMQEVYDLIRQVATTDAFLLISGESGTGKELVARTIHQMSHRARGPFIAINASAIPENLMESEIFGHEKGAFTGAVGMRAGCFELADRGTLFLDEITEMPLSLQPKLLRVLEDGQVRRLGGRQEFTFHVRVLAATNRGVRDAIEQGNLREDLYYRLNVFTIALPPLRERKGDIPLLAAHFLKESNRKHGAKVESISDEAMSILQAHRWPGNVRELRNIIERAVILVRGKRIELAHLAPEIRSPGSDTSSKITLPVGVTAAEAEKELILKTLALAGNNKAEAARQLGLDVKTIRNKLKSYGIE